MNEPVLPIQPDASAAVRVAYAEALRASSDLRRRVDARHQTELSKLRREARTAWHTRNLGDDSAWQRRLSDLVRRRDEAVEELSEQLLALEQCRLGFLAGIRAEHRARRLARGEPEPRRLPGKSGRRIWGAWGPDAKDLEVPW